jgi:hypothetical protein
MEVGVMRKALLGLALVVVLAAPSLAYAHRFRRVVVAAYSAPVVSYSPVVVTSSYYTPVVATPVYVSPAPVVYVSAPPVVATVRYYTPPVVVSNPTVYVVPRR